MFRLLGAVAAIMGVVGEGSEPIYLVAEAAEQGIRLKVIGASRSDLQATFSLEVGGKGNRSLHNGSASLRGGETVTLSTVTLGNVQPGQWQARLTVHPEGGNVYEQVRSSV